MIIDSRTIPSGITLQADICIVGAGPAGITIAREFIDHPAKVFLLESGGTAVREDTQSLCRGNVSGNSYPPLHFCRRRVLGGSSSYWGGWARSLDEIDFEARDWVPFSGWPFGRDHLQVDYARAHAVWKLEESRENPEAHRPEAAGQIVEPTASSFQGIFFAVRAIRFGKTYRQELLRARNLDVLLRANVLEVEMDRHHKTAMSVQVATLAGNRFRVAARNFVLAAGGIENPRILLASRASRSCGIGNDNDLVGRFFADHLHTKLGPFTLNGDCVPRFEYDSKAAASRGGIMLKEEVRRSQKLLGFAVTVHNPDNPHDVVYPTYTNSGYASLLAVAKPLVDGELPELIGFHARTIVRHPIDTVRLSIRRLIKTRWRAFVLGCRAEQIPNPNSRVLLDSERDALGMNKVRLDWRVTEQDRESIRRAQQILHSEWNLPCNRRALNNGEPASDIIPASHHMGTTRMHRDAKLGVVDEMCRVHGTCNLYLAGSSVFPTTGWAPPSLTIMALALRLADFLKQSSR
jgi:choline dehydrogenase-like flavoprotein